MQYMVCMLCSACRFAVRSYLINLEIHQGSLKVSCHHVKVLQIQAMFCDKVEMRCFEVFALVLSTPAKSIHHELHLRRCS